FTNSTAANAPVGERKSTVEYVRLLSPVLLKLPLASVVVLPPPLLSDTVMPGTGAPVGVCTWPVSDWAAAVERTALAASASRRTWDRIGCLHWHTRLGTDVGMGLLDQAVCHRRQSRSRAESERTAHGTAVRKPDAADNRAAKTRAFTGANVR